MSSTSEAIDSEATAVAVREANVPAASPLPVFTAERMVEALHAYRRLQEALDKAMPDQIMELEGRHFRKKGYWRAVAVAFHLTVEPIEERRESDGVFGDGRENFGYDVTYRASTPGGGRFVTGDGSCFAVEKAARFRCPHKDLNRKNWSLHFPPEQCPDFDPEFQWHVMPRQATKHNVRSHAHTRAYNRAVSNLVGFGEVSAEEVERGDPTHGGGGNGHADSDGDPNVRKATPGQITLLHARAKAAGLSEEDFRDQVYAKWKITSFTELLFSEVDDVIEWLKTKAAKKA